MLLGGFEMKIRDLLNVDKAIKLKNKELEDKKYELEKLRQEAEELKLIVDFNNKQYSKEELINITDMYYVKNRNTGVVYFATKMVSNVLDYKFVDIFTNETITSFSSYTLSVMESDRNSYELYFCKPINLAFPEVRVYLDRMVPKILLQKLYYQANGIYEKALRLGAIKD